MTRSRPGLPMGATHWAAPTDHRTACGKWALDEDGTTRLLETDADIDGVSCRSCRRASCRRGGLS
ncbi:MAG TPA: hypothetical protein VM347_44380 [Nonomuraea sp.]|nr:hypothetical protein [Nonomuraea sp.]